MSLQQLIESGNYSTAEQAHQAILAQSVEVRDDQQYTWAGVADVIGPEAAEGLRMAFDANGLGWVSLQLGGLGLPLSDSRVQQALLGFAQAGVTGCDVLAAKGISMKAPWQVAGLAQAPTLQEVQQTWSTINTEPDTWTHEVLLSVNRQPDGSTQAFARVTPVGLKDGQVVQRGEAQVYVNGDLLAVVGPIMEGLINA